MRPPISTADAQIKVIQDAMKRRRRALALRRDGKTLREIAEALGLSSRQRASQLVQRAELEEALAKAVETRK